MEKYFIKKMKTIRNNLWMIFVNLSKRNNVRKMESLFRRLDTRVAEQLYWDSVAHIYDEKILSPLFVKENNPLLDYVNNIQENELVVADVGCGTGTLVVKLASDDARFKKIYGIDYSTNMVEISKNRCKDFKNVEILKMDMRDLTPLREKLKQDNCDVDVIFSINSILPRNPEDTEVMLNQIAATLKPGARFVAILPSFDTIEYLKRLEFTRFKEKREEYLQKYFKNLPFKEEISYLLAWFETRKLFSRKRKMNVKKRLYSDNGINIQRFIHKDDIIPLLKNAGLRGYR